MNGLSEARHRLRLLHVSDIHEKAAREKERARRYRVLVSEAWERNVEALLEDGRIDLICFTGDAADWGKAEEYERVTTLFRVLLGWLDLPPDRLFVIPGNHDIDRGIHRDAWEGLKAQLDRNVDPLRFARWASRGALPPAFDEAWHDQILARQGPYRSWVKDTLGRPELLPEASPHGSLGYRCTIKLPHLPGPVHLIGLDTAWLCGEKVETGRLRLTDGQVQSLTTDADGRPLDGVRIAMMHHPFAELGDGKECRRLIADHADIVLRGHLHDPEVELWADPDRRLPNFAAGCLYESDRADQYPNSLQVLTLELDEAGRLARGAARFRSWSSRGHWHDDDSLYEASRNGRLSWTLPERPVRTAGAARNPYNPWVEARPPRFAGRTALLRQLDAALEERRSVSIVGDRRIGKSSLLTTFALAAEPKGRVVRCLSGQKREGASIGAFVQVVTGWPAPEGADEAADLLERWTETTGLPGLPPVLVIDEFDDMLGGFDDRFFERLRGMLGRVVLVVATRVPIDLIYRRLGRTSPFENQLQLRRLGLLEVAAADTIVGWGRPTLLEHDGEMMREQAGCHPCFLQLLGHQLFNARQHGDHLDEAMSAFRFEAAARLRELWRGLDDGERQALQASARGEPITKRSLIDRGIATSEGRPFGTVLTEWLVELPE